jgi:hypothetical protein
MPPSETKSVPDPAHFPAGKPSEARDALRLVGVVEHEAVSRETLAGYLIGQRRFHKPLVEKENVGWSELVLAPRA